MDSEQFARTSKPNVTVISDGQEARNKYGHRFGSQQLTLSRDHILALYGGKQLAIDIMEDEYVLFVNMEI